MFFFKKINKSGLFLKVTEDILLLLVGEKPVYQCELCPATCGRKTDLRIHVQKLHTSDKPLKCKRCGKQFPDRYTYKVRFFFFFVSVFYEYVKFIY